MNTQNKELDAKLAPSFLTEDQLILLEQLFTQKELTRMFLVIIQRNQGKTFREIAKIVGKDVSSVHMSYKHIDKVLTAISVFYKSSHSLLLQELKTEIEGMSKENHTARDLRSGKYTRCDDERIDSHNQAIDQVLSLLTTKEGK